MPQTNITATTPGNLLFRGGRLLVNAVDLGALEGDVTFRIAKEDYWPPLAGAAGEVKGTRYRMKEEAFLEVILTELQLAGLARAIAGVHVSSNASSEVLGSSDDSSDVVGCISATEYVPITYTVEQCDGLTTVISMWNCIADGDFEAVFRDLGHFSFAVTFKATYDSADPDMRPWAIVHNVA